MSEPITELLSIEDLMEVLKVGKNTAYDLLESGTIKAFKIGRVWKIPLNTVENYIYDELNKKMKNNS